MINIRLKIRSMSPFRGRPLSDVCVWMYRNLEGRKSGCGWRVSTQSEHASRLPNFVFICFHKPDLHQPNCMTEPLLFLQCTLKALLSQQSCCTMLFVLLRSFSALLTFIQRRFCHGKKGIRPQRPYNALPYKLHSRLYPQNFCTALPIRVNALKCCFSDFGNMEWTKLILNKNS